MQEIQAVFNVLDSLFIGFGLSVILVLIASLFKGENLKVFASKFRHNAIVVIRVLGIAYLVTYFISLLFYFYSGEATLFNSRATGPYAWAYWMMLLRPLVFCGLAQLFWIKRIKNSKRITLFLALLITLIALASGANFERLVILITSFHRDYLPSSWKPDHEVLDFSLLLFLVIIKNIVLFSGLVFLTWYLSKKTTTPES